MIHARSLAYYISIEILVEVSSRAKSTSSVLFLSLLKEVEDDFVEQFRNQLDRIIYRL